MRRWPAWATPLLFLALAIAWTWPAAIAGDAVLVGRNFDLPGTLWFIDAAHRLGWSAHDAATGFPEGTTYSRPDSYVLLVLGPLLGKLGAVRAHNLLQVVGPALSAWAAEAFAREVGARAPWSILAGLSFAFGALAANVLLEGHVYHLFDPWMPLFALAFWRATGPTGRWTHGVAAGLLYGLTLLSSAYLGLAGAIVAIGFAAGGLLEGGRRRLLPMLAAAGALSPILAFYLLRFTVGGGQAIVDYQRFGVSRAEFLRSRSAGLVDLAVATPSTDLFFHSYGFALPAVVLCLCLAAPRLMRGLPRWRTLAATALLGLVLTLGTELGSPELGTLPLPLALVADTPLADFLRFPIRLGWAFSLCAGALAAWVATVLAPRAGWPAALLLLGALAEPFVVQQLPARQWTWPAAIPSAYAAAEGPILDLVPEAPAREYEINAWLAAWPCYYQTRHGRPIADDCVGTHSQRNPRMDKAREIEVSLLRGEVELARQEAARWQFATLAVHPDLFVPGDRARILAGLALMDPEPVETIDGGERIVAFQVAP